MWGSQEKTEKTEEGKEGEATIKEGEATIKEGEGEGEQKVPEEPKPTKSEILGGFFIFRASPTSKNLDDAIIEASKPENDEGNEDDEGNEGNEGDKEIREGGGGGDYSQKGELVGMVLIKQKGNRKFLGFVQIDPESNTVDKFMTNFVDTDLSNQLDNSKTNVFEYSFLDKLIERCVLQKIEIPGRNGTGEGTGEGTGDETWKDSGSD
jgi:hypothetical protein